MSHIFSICISFSPCEYNIKIHYLLISVTKRTCRYSRNGLSKLGSVVITHFTFLLFPFVNKMYIRFMFQSDPQGEERCHIM